VNKILLSNSLGGKLNILEENKLGSESNHFEQILGRKIIVSSNYWGSE
jgi:hypothetical protein